MKQYKEIETDKSKKTIKRTVILMSALILIGITVLIGTSYALFSTTLHGEKKVSIQTGTFEVEMTDGEYIKEESMGTLTDKEGKKTKPYTFTITNASTETIGAYYRLYLTEESGNLNTYYLKYELKGNDGSQKEGRIGTLSSFYINKYLEANGSVTYELRLWLDEETPDSEQGKNYQSKIAVEGSQIPINSENAVEKLLVENVNDDGAEFSDITKNKMFVFHHEAGTQQEGWTEEELTDYRYIGADPNNYVTFNGEKAGWRIIGIFTVENEKGEKEKRIKIMKADSMDSIAWDTEGVNDWTKASLMKAINPDTGETTYNLAEEGKKMIGAAKWYLGGRQNSEITPSEIYKDERGTKTCQTTGTCNTNRPTYWIGKVGLMYPSDYGYATSDSNCLASKNLYNYDTESCRNNDWIYKSLNPTSNSVHQWTLSSNSGYSDFVFNVTHTGSVIYYNNVTNKLAVRPVVYLLSNIQYTQGTGSKADPFIFSN